MVAGLVGIGCGGDPGTGLPGSDGPFGRSAGHTTCAPTGGISVQSLGGDAVCPPGTTPVATSGPDALGAPHSDAPADKASDPSFAPNDDESEGDEAKGNNGVGNGQDPQPPGDPPINDGPGTSPGAPGNKP
jgi:hypothetical protein